ncbi:bublin coiled-coil protein [Stigmatopora nigra]
MSGPNGDPDIAIDDGFIEDSDEFSDDEFATINSMLDQINSYLDGLEERNDALNSKMHELMESNRQARIEFRAQMDVRQPEDDHSALPGTKEDHHEEPREASN